MSWIKRSFVPQSELQFLRDSELLVQQLMHQSNTQEAEAVLEAWLNLFAGATPQSDCALPEAAVRQNIGIWLPVSQNGESYFVRDDEDQSAFLWAETPRLGPKLCPLRVVLIGESVARGFPFSPGLSCASVLRRLLHLGYDPEEVEVIDISRNGLSLPQLSELVQSARQLEADFYVVFAGNNWPANNLSSANLWKSISDIRAKQSWRACSTHIDAIQRQQADVVMASLGLVAREDGCSVVFVIPECNLLDWCPSDEWRSPILTQAETLEWERLRKNCELSLGQDDLSSAQTFARELVQLEEGLSVHGLRFQARCAWKEGDLDQARALFEHSRDCRAYIPVSTASFGCFCAVQDQIRSAAAAHEVVLVDLPSRLASLTGNVIPGRETFVDYVHMTPRGIGLSMACVAERIWDRLGKPVTFSALDAVEVAGPPEQIALGHFAAAIINSQNPGVQTDSLVRHHCVEALGASPKVVEAMELYADFSIRRAPSYMCKSFQLFAESNGTLLPKILSERQEKEAYSPIVRAIVELNGSAVLRDKLQALFEEEHDIANGQIDLIRPPYCNVSRYHLEYDRRGRAYFVAYTRHSDFWFVSPTAQPVQVRFAFRVPGPLVSGALVRMSVNGVIFKHFPALSTWTAHDFVLEKKHALKGTNEIRIIWPISAEGDSRSIRSSQIASALENHPFNESQTVPDLYPTFGEVHELLAWIPKATFEGEPLSPAG
jgi:hypothetical protein